MLHIHKRSHRFSLAGILSFFIIAFCIILFSFVIQRSSQDNLLREQQTLENALRESAVHYYALEGQYPESLSVLLNKYHITYDPEKFIIDYEPQISNMLPNISVIPTGNSGKELPS